MYRNTHQDPLLTASFPGQYGYETIPLHNSLLHQEEARDMSHQDRTKNNQ